MYEYNIHFNHDWIKELIIYCDIYGFSYEIISMDTVKVYTEFDEWVVEFIDGKTYKFLLHHISSMIHPMLKPHKQRSFIDLEFLFRSLYTHDGYVRRRYLFSNITE